MDKKSIGIIGAGFVGQILKKWFPLAVMFDPYVDGYRHSLFIYDCDIVFIAFNLKDNAFQNVEPICEHIKKFKKQTTFIIKSTFVPGTTDALQKEFPEHRFIYNPEFLTELTAWNDFENPQFQILGATNESLPYVQEIFQMLPGAPDSRVISPLDAEILKHSFNSYFALKVTWFNQLFDACQELGADYATVRDIMIQHPWVGNSHAEPFHKGYRGFGGKCLSKDPLNFTKVAKLPLLEKVIEINDAYLQSK